MIFLLPGLYLSRPIAIERLPGRKPDLPADIERFPICASVSNKNAGGTFLLLENINTEFD